MSIISTNNSDNEIKSFEPLYVIRNHLNNSNSTINIQCLYDVSLIYNNQSYDYILFGNSIGQILLANLTNRRIINTVNSVDNCNSPIVSIDSDKRNGLITLNNNTINNEL